MAGLLRKIWTGQVNPLGGSRPGGRTGRIRTEDKLLVCFLAGLMGGTVMVNLLSSSVSSQAGYYLSLMNQNMGLSQSRQMDLFLRILRERVGQLILAWLVGLTVYGIWFFSIASAAAGAGVGVIIALLTEQKGLLGLPVYIASIVPQALLYVPVWCFLFLWGSSRTEKMKFPVLLVLLVITVLGCACETWLNPVFLGFVL